MVSYFNGLSSDRVESMVDPESGVKERLLAVGLTEHGQDVMLYQPIHHNSGQLAFRPEAHLIDGSIYYAHVKVSLLFL